MRGLAQSPGKLIFVYNANSDVVSEVIGFGHRFLSPSTYYCRLCDLTYGVFSMKDRWRNFVEGLHLPVEFLHKDDLPYKYPALSALELPALFHIDDQGVVSTVVSAKEMNQASDLESLILMISNQLADKL